MAYKQKSPIPISEGGTGDQSFTSYAVVCGGTASTNPLQSIASVGTSGQILTSNGAGLLPTFQAASASGAITTITGNTGGAESPSAGNFNIVTSNSNIVFTGSAATETLNFALTSNILLGSTGSAITTGVDNTALGVTALAAVTSGEDNVAIGYESLMVLTDGLRNTALGWASGNSISSGDDNVVLGYNAADALTTGNGNIAIGSGSNATLSTDSNSIAIGSSSASLSGALAGALSISMGTGAECFSSLGIAIGNGQGTSVGAFTANGIAIGNARLTLPGAMAGMIGSGGAIAIGTGTDYNTGSVAGASAGASSTNYDIAIGSGATATGGSAITLGFAASSSGAQSIAIGGSDASLTAGASSTGAASIAIGSTDNSRIGATSSGTRTIAIGTHASATGAFDSIAIGTDSVSSANSGIAIGNGTTNSTAGRTQIGANGVQTSCLIAGIDGVNVGSVAKVVTMASDQLGTATLTAGSNITITPGANTITIDASGGITELDGDVGVPATSPTISITGANSGGTVIFTSSLSNVDLTVTDASNNTAVGGQAGGNLSGGSPTDQTAFGFQALNSCSGGAQNSAFGSQSLLSITTGTDNVGIGYASMPNAAGPSTQYNTIIGSTTAANYSGGTESSNIVIGYGITGTLSESNVLRIGNGSGTGAGNLNSAFIAGIAGVSVSNTNMVTINTSTGQLGSQAVPSGAIAWTVITANQTAAVNHGYFCNKAGTLALALPTTSAVGDEIEVVNINTATGTQFTQSAGQQIFFATSSTTLGATGTLTSSAVGDSLRMVCSVANTTWWVVSSIGNWTVV